MKKKFSTPQIEILYFCEADIIVTSLGEESDEGSGNWTPPVRE